MIEFKLNIDISDRFENAVKALADAIVMREKLRHEYAQGWERAICSQTADEQCQDTPEKEPESEGVSDQEKAEEAPAPAESEPSKEPESEGVSDQEKAEEAQEPPRTAEPAECEKPQKKARAKAQKTAPEPVPEKAPERVAPEATSKPTEAAPETRPVESEPERAPECVAPEVTPKPAEPEKAQGAIKESNEDSMQGMNLMQAVKAITDELRERGVEMADVNARVRRRANELGLSYSSFTCLVKAIGYTEARRVALGE